MMNQIVSECINKLSALKLSLKDVKGTTATSDGINSANASVKESIDTRISLLEDLYPDQEQPYKNADYAAFCLEFVDSLEEVFTDLAKESNETEFELAYKRQIESFLILLKQVQHWLRTV